MARRFGLGLEVIDRGRLEEVRRSTELGANPFKHLSLGLASIDLLKQERVLDQLERTSYGMIVIGEAHHCMDLGAAQEREDSQRRRLADMLSRRCDALLLLTATPHDANDRSFASLCELLDPSLVDGWGMLRGERYRPHVVRRMKSHVPGFKTRIVEPRPVIAYPAAHPAFVALHRALLVGNIHDDVFEVQLPVAWSYVLDALPEYDDATRTLSLTAVEREERGIIWSAG